jgi:hypothetical protein
MKHRMRWHFSAVVLVAALGVGLSGCTEHASEADKAAAARNAASRQQQQDEAIAARKGIDAATGLLAQLPPPAKSRYLLVRTISGWKNPFLIVSRKTVTLQFTDPRPEGSADASVLPNGVLPKQQLSADGPGRKQIVLRLIDLPEALAALPESSWEYGRVVAVDEDPATPRAERPQMRRNIEAVMALLNDLDIVVDEWPNTGR